MVRKKIKKTNNSTSVPSTSSVKMDEMQKKIDKVLNDKELQRSIDEWIKHNDLKGMEINRDINMLGAIIQEYLDSFIIFGYNLEGERIIIQSYANPKDKDAMMEFLKNVFFKFHGGPEIDG